MLEMGRYRSIDAPNSDNVEPQSNDEPATDGRTKNTTASNNVQPLPNDELAVDGRTRNIIAF